MTSFEVNAGDRDLLLSLVAKYFSHAFVVGFYTFGIAGSELPPGDISDVVYIKRSRPVHLTYQLKLGRAAPRERFGHCSDFHQHLSEIRRESDVGPGCPVGFGPTSSV